MMRKTFYILLTCLLYSTVVLAQSSTRSIIEDINKSKVGQGKVRVMQDETIDNRLALYSHNSDTTGIIRLSNEIVSGYKIQVFSGNNQHKSRNEAESKQSLLRRDFPQHQALVTYSTPSWKLRVGNFLTRAEAEVVLEEIRKAFPSFGKEMYIVPSDIRRPLGR